MTRQPVTLDRPFDGGGTVQVGQLVVPAAALYGAGGGEQTGRLVRVPAGTSTERMEALGLRAQIALATCTGWAGDDVTWSDLVDRALRAGALGLVLVQDCDTLQVQRVPATPCPSCSSALRTESGCWRGPDRRPPSPPASSFAASPATT
ncbi:hypothetical protein ACFP9V_03575 [Deinococcus radiopugnans]|uniref:hypothetical protein n=1 Tax=Deinococcus radiopugnans TaxID=57497 RepID=UPI003619FCA7